VGCDTLGFDARYFLEGYGMKLDSLRYTFYLENVSNSMMPCLKSKIILCLELKRPR
jgi:hypothetical protein